MVGNARGAADTKAAFQAASKWSKPVLERGFTVVPNLLLSHQHSLGLSSLECMLIMHLITYWWESDKNPYPSKAVLAQRMGISERQVQRYVSGLIKKGFVRRKQEEIRGRAGRAVVSFDLGGLVEKLKKLDAVTRNVPALADEEGKDGW